MGVDGEGKNDNLGPMGFNDLAKTDIGGLIDEEGIFNEGKVVAGDVEKIPEMGVAVDEGEVEATEKIIQFGAGFGKGIRYVSGASAKTNGVGEALGGGVMAVSKSCGQDEDRGRIHIRPSRSSSSRRRSSD